MDTNIKLSWCGLCKRITIICPLCGNNSCNGYVSQLNDKGEVLSEVSSEKGTDCPMCSKSRELLGALFEFEQKNNELCRELFQADKAEKKQIDFYVNVLGCDREDFKTW